MNNDTGSESCNCGRRHEDEQVPQLRTAECWLPDALVRRLEAIRSRVRDIYKSHEERKQQPRWFTPHGPGHCQAVEELLFLLIPRERHRLLTDQEKFFLLASAWIHDLGMLRGIVEGNGETDEAIRERHELRAEEYLVNQFSDVKIDEHEANAFGMLARFHRRRQDLQGCPLTLPVGREVPIRLRLLASYLRLADALHVDQTRTPAEQYAISLAYDIPSNSKLHWLRSKFVHSIEIAAERKEIIVHFKQPMEEPQESHCGISDSEQGQAICDKIRSRNPECDPALGSVCDVVAHEMSSARGAPLNEDAVIREIMVRKRMMQGIHDLVLNDLKSELRSVQEVLYLYDVTTFLRVSIQTHPVIVDDLLKQDIACILNYYDLLDNPSSTALLTVLLDSVKALLDSRVPLCRGARGDYVADALDALDGLLDDVKDAVLKSRPCHTALAQLISELENWVTLIRNPAAEESVQDLRVWVGRQRERCEEARRGVRRSAVRYFTAITDPKYPWTERRIWCCDGIRKKTIDVLLYGYSELVIKALCGFREALLIGMLGKYAAEADGEANRRDDSVAWPEYKQALSRDSEERIPWPPPSARPCFPLKDREMHPEDRCPVQPFHRRRLEREASRRFRIFVCEGQPKNRTRWEGGVIFHDGTRYALALAEHRFTNIYVVPDAIAGTLIAPFRGTTTAEELCPSPRIDFVMVGANGFDDEQFYHSAGHATMVAAALGARHHQKRGVPEEDRREGPANWPKIMLALSTDKYRQSRSSGTPGAGDPDGGQSSTPTRSAVGGAWDGACREQVRKIGGWQFHTGFSNEPVRMSPFFCQDVDLQRRLGEDQYSRCIAFYNPREDRIDIECVDVVVTERCWISREQVEHRARAGSGTVPGAWPWTGRAISEANIDGCGQ